MWHHEAATFGSVSAKVQMARELRWPSDANYNMTSAELAIMYME